MTSKKVTLDDRLVAGTAFHFCREDQQGAYDYLFVDEAGQVSLGNLIAMAGAARNLILSGDQKQLPQPIEGFHPAETGQSCLEYLLPRGQPTVAAHLGIFLDRTYRLPDDLCEIISTGIDDGRLKGQRGGSTRHLVLGPNPTEICAPPGSYFIRCSTKVVRRAAYRKPMRSRD